MIAGQDGGGWTAPGKSLSRGERWEFGLAGGESSHAIPGGRGRRDRRVLRRAAARGRPRRHVPGPARPGPSGSPRPGWPSRARPATSPSRRRRPSWPPTCGTPFDVVILSCKAYDLDGGDRVRRPGGGAGHGRRAAAQRHAAPRRARRPVRPGPRAGRVVLHLGEARRRRAGRPRQRHPPAGVRRAVRRAVAAGGRDRRGHGGREVRGRRERPDRAGDVGEVGVPGGPGRDHVPDAVGRRRRRRGRRGRPGGRAPGGVPGRSPPPRATRPAPSRCRRPSAGSPTPARR